MGRSRRCLLYFFLLGSTSLFGQVHLDSLYQKLASEKDKSKVADAYIEYGFKIYDAEPDSAIQLAQKAYNLSVETKNNDQCLLACELLGLANQQKGAWQLALDHFFTGLSCVEKGQQKPEVARTYHNIAVSYRNLKNNDTALLYEEQAASILERSNDYFSLGSVYYTMGNIYRDKKDIAQAEQFFLKALDAYGRAAASGKREQLSAYANTYNAYGNLLQSAGRLPEAIDQHKKAITLHANAGNVYEAGIAYENLGNDHMLQKESGLAYMDYENAKRMMFLAGRALDLGYEFLKMGEASNAAGNYRRALEKLDSALVLFRATQAHSYRRDTYAALTDAYNGLHKTEEAFATYKSFVALRDSLSNASMIEEIASLKNELNTLAAQKRTPVPIADDEKSNRMFSRNAMLVASGVALILLLCVLFLIRGNVRLKQQNRNTEAINSIVTTADSDVMETLQNIKLMSAMAILPENKDQSQKILHSIRKQTGDAIDTLQDALWASDPVHDNLHYFLERMESYFTDACTAHSVQGEFRNEVKRALPLHMLQLKGLLTVFKESVDNAFKHAQAKKIIVKMYTSGKYVYMSVTDDGIGFQEKQVVHRGITKMEATLRPLGGDLQINAVPQVGTEVNFRIPYR
ncbi:MAG: tetratricopeptide repeat protein [Chitinophagales bacterium]